jgi:hypothetical protein
MCCISMTCSLRPSGAEQASYGCPVTLPRDRQDTALVAG